MDNKGFEIYFSSHYTSDSLSEVSRLYKDLALALCKSVSEASCGSLDDDDLKDKEEWNELITQGGAELVNASAFIHGHRSIECANYEDC